MMTLSTIPLHERPALVREACEALGIAGFIIPRGDEYLGEYVAPCAERLAWLTGFTGSAGLAIILRDAAAVFSDGRYTVQMEQQVPASLWERRHVVTEPPRAWLSAHAQGLKLGYDPHLVSQSMLDGWRAEGVELVPVSTNPIDRAWHDRPAPPAGPVQSHPVELAGESSDAKRARLAAILRAEKQDAAVIADTTSLAWLLNIRGSDVPMTPVVQAYGILHADATAELFVDARRVPTDVTQALANGVKILPPADLEARLAALAGRRVRVDQVTTPVWFGNTLRGHGAVVVDKPDLNTLPKAIKNPVEQDGAARAHALDGVALARFLYFVEAEGVGLRETDLVTRLDAFRAVSEAYRGQSFDTISAAGPNGAFPHYRAEKGQDRVLEPNSVYLIDSGGQYPFGTTDITRTVWLGTDAPPQDIRSAFTRVLKGNIALSLVRFPPDTPGFRLDTLARAALWEVGLDYDHGTGHGIGSYLSVHEGPQNISPAVRQVGLKPGMIISNEPGYYEPGRYGIRIENLLLVKESAIAGVKGRFLEFEVLSFTPIDRRLIDPALLDTREREWLNQYHAEVLRRVGPELTESERLWLGEACRPL